MWNAIKATIKEHKLISALLLGLLIFAAWRAFQGDFTNLLTLGVASGIGATAGALERRRQAVREQRQTADLEDLENTDAIIAEAEQRAAADEKISQHQTPPPKDLWDKNAKLPPP